MAITCKIIEKKSTKHAFKKLCSIKSIRLVDRYAAAGVSALSNATPRQTGITAESWNYTANKGSDGFEISWNNSNANKGVNIALILQYGHATGTGGWVEGRDYVNPAIDQVVEQLERDIQREVKKVV